MKTFDEWVVTTKIADPWYWDMVQEGYDAGIAEGISEGRRLEREKIEGEKVGDFYRGQLAGIESGIEEGKRIENARMMKFAEWWAGECDVFNGTEEEAFEYWTENVEGKDEARTT